MEEKALIVSIGGSPEPIIKSIQEYAPSFVCFFASQESITQIGDISKAFPDMQTKYKTVLTDDASDLMECYRKAKQCVDECTRQQYNIRDITADFTGGTKAMTAALALAALTQGCRFSYISGSQRTKNGLGTVVTGTELIKGGLSPYWIFAEEAKRNITHLFNAYQFPAVIQIIQNLNTELLADSEKLFFKVIHACAHAYHEWDNFRYDTAIKYMKDAYKMLPESSKHLLPKPLQTLQDCVREHLPFLTHLPKNTKSFTVPHPDIMTDMYCNALRRAEEGKYDDAVIRLYRIIEMAGQIAFLEVKGKQNSKATEDMVPESLREEYKTRYLHEDGILKLPLEATFKLLAKEGNEMGQWFFDDKNRKRLKQIQFARNNSILIHGTQHLTEATYEDLKNFIQQFLNIQNTLVFPKLHVS